MNLYLVVMADRSFSSGIATSPYFFHIHFSCVCFIRVQVCVKLAHMYKHDASPMNMFPLDAYLNLQI